MKFRERIGKVKTYKELQIESLDSDLLNGLWNTYYKYILCEIGGASKKVTKLTEAQHSLIDHLWINVLKRPIDLAPRDNYDFMDEIKKIFYSLEWYEVYTLIEESYTHLKEQEYLENGETHVTNEFNKMLEGEFSGYRFINDILSPITNYKEIESIEQSLDNTIGFSALKGCNIHLKMALLKLSDRTAPDYRNSIKESISAVESMAKIISGKQKDTLGASLDRIKGTIKLHEALERGFKQLYGYTSDEGGIRHALMDSPNCDFDDAKYMLISCSAFINYLISKANKAGISFQ